MAPLSPDAAVTATLSNGLVVTLRPLQPGDRERLAAAARALDRDSIYLRLFSYRKELTDAGLDRIMHVDPANEIVLLAETGSGDAEAVIGAARYVVSGSGPGGEAAEIAFMVEESYQGLGIAGRLLRRLAEVARARGVATFEAEVLAGNEAMLNVFLRSGMPLRKRSEGGVVHLTLDLGAAA
jgi:GNAT superfamily N-acetyltransferase